MPKAYSRPQIILHWVVFVLVAVQFILHEPIAQAWRTFQSGQPFTASPQIVGHVVCGLVILAFVLWRLWIRLTRGVPPPQKDEGPAVKLAATIAHWTLYALMIGLPLTGAVAWFGGSQFSADVHVLLESLLLAVVGLHVYAIGFRQLVLKRNLIERMRKPE